MQSRDLGASNWTTFQRVIFPLTINGVKAGIQAVFIPALSLFMITRLIAGNKVITLGTAIEQQFLSYTKLGNGFYNRRILNYIHGHYYDHYWSTRKGGYF